MDPSEAQAAADRRYAALKRRGWGRDQIRDALIDEGYARDQANCIVDGFPLETAAPPVGTAGPEGGPCPDDAGPEDGAAPSPPDLTDRAFWELALGGAANARWLLQDPAVEAAIATGRPLLIHRAFAKRASSAPPGPPSEAYRATMRNYRLFLEPRESPPGLGSLNGVGARLFGRADPNPRDGTYIVTRAFSLLFVPIWPFDRFLVRDAGGSRYFLLGRVPLAPVHHGWRRVLVGLVLLVVAVNVVGAWRRGRYADVHVVNDLDVAVAVQAAGETFPLAPHAHVVRRLPVGRQRIVTTRPPGREIENLEVDVMSGGIAQVYNVLGAAPLAEARIEYVDEQLPASSWRQEPSGETFHGGRAWTRVPNVDFAFRTPPQRIEMPAGRRRTTRTWLGLVCSGWRRCAEQLYARERAAEARALVRAVARATPEDEDALSWAWSAVAAEGAEAAKTALLDELLAIAPDAVTVNRLVQDHARARGEGASLLPVYEAAWRADPRGEGRAYLYARLLDPGEAAPVLDEALAVTPGDPWLLRAKVWEHLVTADYGGAVPVLETAVKLSAGELEYGWELAWALACRGRFPAALRALEQALEPYEGRGGCLLVSDLTGAVGLAIALHEAIRTRLPDPSQARPLERYVRMFEEDEEAALPIRAYLLARARDRAGIDRRLRDRLDPATERFVEAMVLSRDDVHAAAEVLLASSEPLGLPLDPESCLAIACELHRLGASERAAAVLESSGLVGAGLSTVKDLEALPTLPARFPELGPRLQAVLLRAASRKVADTDPGEAGRLAYEARRFDPGAFLIAED